LGQTLYLICSKDQEAQTENYVSRK